jgi:hypothetical protein
VGPVRRDDVLPTGQGELAVIGVRSTFFIFAGPRRPMGRRGHVAHPPRGRPPPLMLLVAGGDVKGKVARDS